MKCETETVIGVRDSIEQVTCLERIADNGGFWVRGIQWSQNGNILIGSKIALHLGSKLTFTDKDGKVYRYDIKTKTDAFRMINEMTMAIALENI